MNAKELLQEMTARGVRLEPDGERLHVTDPAHTLTHAEVEQLRQHKHAILALLAPMAAAHADDAEARAAAVYETAQSALADEAARLSPAIRFTLRETEDVMGDVLLLRSIRLLLEEWPGGNRVVFRIITLEGEVHRLQWRAYASAALRRQIANLLARRALSGATNRGADATAMSGRSGQSRPGYPQ